MRLSIISTILCRSVPIRRQLGFVALSQTGTFRSGSRSSRGESTMPKSENSSKVPIVLIFLFSALFFNTSLSAQSEGIRERPKGLQEQINELKETQKAILKELQETKNILQGRAAQPNLPPLNLTVSIDGSPFKGNESTKLTLIEFSDYQCPFCARHFRETLPQVEREYINTGKIKYVLRDFPIESIHKDAFKAAESARCAGEQGKYWEMHDRLFYNQSLLGTAELPKHAQAIGLSLSSFQQCLEGGKYAAQIRRDIEEGRSVGVNGTPSFFLGVKDSDSQSIKVLRMIVGAQPYGQFKQAIEEILREIAK